MAVAFKDYYEQIGVDRDASPDAIKKAFRKLARKYHPDHAGGDPAAEDKFKEINEAYEVLSDPEKRKRYDQLGANWQHGSEFTPPPGWGSRGGPGGGRHPEGFDFHFGGSGFSDFFEQFFAGSGGNGFSGAGRPQQKESLDIEGDMLVTLAEAELGTTRRIQLRSQDRRTGAESTETVEVKIPAGIVEGQRIRLSGKGRPSAFSAAVGDCFLRVKFERHPDFRVEGCNLIHELHIPVWDAALGAKTPVPTLRETVKITIPEGAKQGQRMRLKGLGRLDKNGTRGDLFVELKIDIPAPRNDDEKRLWQALKAASQKG